MIKKLLMILLVLVMLAAPVSASIGYYSTYGNEIWLDNEEANLTKIMNDPDIEDWMISDAGNGVWYLNVSIWIKGSNGKLVLSSDEVTELRIDSNNQGNSMAIDTTNDGATVDFQDIVIRSWNNSNMSGTNQFEDGVNIVSIFIPTLSNVTFDGFYEIRMRNIQNDTIYNNIHFINGTGWRRIFSGSTYDAPSIPAYNVTFSNWLAEGGAIGGYRFQNFIDSKFDTINLSECDANPGGIQFMNVTDSYLYNITQINDTTAGIFLDAETATGYKSTGLFAYNLYSTGSEWNAINLGSDMFLDGVTALNVHHNGMDFHNDENTTVQNIYIGHTDSNAFLFTGGYADWEGSHHNTIRDFVSAEDGVWGNNNLSYIYVINGSLIGGGVGLSGSHHYIENCTFQNASLNLYDYNGVKELGGNIPEYANNITAVDCSFDTLHINVWDRMSENQNTTSRKIINCNWSSTDGGYANHLVYQYPNIKVTDSLGNALSGVTIDVTCNDSSISAVNAHGTNQSSVITQSTGKMNTPLENRNNCIALADYMGVGNTEIDYKTYQWNVTASKDGYSDNSTTITVDDSYYTSDLSTFAGEEIVIVLEDGAVPPVAEGVSEESLAETIADLITSGILLIVLIPLVIAAGAIIALMNGDPIDSVATITDILKTSAVIIIGVIILGAAIQAAIFAT